MSLDPQPGSPSSSFAAGVAALVPLAGALGGTHEPLCWLGQSLDGGWVGLARERAGGALVTLAFPSDWQGGRAVPAPQAEAVVPAELALPLGEGLAADDPATGSLPRATLLQAVADATATSHELLGDLPREVGGGLVYFAVSRTDGTLHLLQLQRERQLDGTEEHVLAVIPLPPVAGPTLDELAPPPRPDAGGTRPMTLAFAVPGRHAQGHAQGQAEAQAPATPPRGAAAAATPATPATPGSSKLCPQCEREYPADVRFCPVDGATLRGAATGDDLVGHVIADRYHVQRMLGEGGMGRVYLAEHVRMGRRSAVKVMGRNLVNDRDALSRFNREASNASRVSHHHVAAIYDFGETTDGLVYLAMEYVDGEPLTGVLAREKALAPARAATIVGQVGDGLDAAHALGIVHRDLKPDNIMVTQGRDGGDWVKIVDFGIAKADSGEKQQVTKTGLVIGTPEYMSPEQLTADTVDARSDVYALALVAFVLLTGALPFTANTTEQLLMARLVGAPRTLAEVRPDVAWPEELQAVLTRGLAKDPAERFGSAGAFGRALAAAVQGWVGTPLAAAVTPASATPVGAAALPPTRVAAPAAAGRAAGQAAAGATPAPVAAAPRGNRGGVLVAAAAVLLLAAAGGGWMLLGPDGDAASPAGDSTAVKAPALASNTPAAPSAADTSVAGPEPLSAATDPAAPASPADAPADAGAGAPGGGAATPVSTPPRAPAALSARAELDRIRSLIANDATGAEVALDALPRLRRQLRSAADSLEADYYEAEANGVLGRIDRSCRIFVRIQPRAQGSALGPAIDNYVKELECR